MENRTSGKFSIGHFRLGAEQLSLNLKFAPSGHVTGKGRIYQATNPPRNLSMSVSGTFEKSSSDRKSSQVITLTGHVASTRQVNLHVTITLDDAGPIPGFASYKYLNSPDVWVEQQRVPVSVTWPKVKP